MAGTLEREFPGFKIKTLVEKIRNSVPRNPFPYSRDQLSWKYALDATFLLQFLKSIRKALLWYAIKNDILMLENQVPMFVLIEAFLCMTNIESDTQLVNSSQREISQDDRRFQGLDHLADLLQAACKHFNPLISDGNSLPQPPDLNSTRHLLGYLYHYVTAASPEHRQSESQSTTTAGNLPSATELSEAGIKFASYDSGDLRKICFKTTTSTFLLPKITINNSTGVVLRNLVTFELNLKRDQKPHMLHIFDGAADSYGGGCCSAQEVWRS